MLTRCPEYFDFLEERGDNSGARTSRCHKIFAEKKRCLGRPGQGVYAAQGSNLGLADPTARQAYYSRVQALTWTGAYRGDMQRVRRAVDAQGRGVEGAAQVGVPPAALVPSFVGHRVGDLLTEISTVAYRAPKAV